MNAVQQKHIFRKIDSMAGIHGAYLVLMVLSSALCTFGLLANSPATVIGAATMAPLTGPIMGVSLGLVRGEMARFRVSLFSEAVGALTCVLIGLLLARLFGAQQIDYNQQEIVANLRPTLLDLAIGFAAGLAGAYSSVDRRIMDSVAGVAIAVTLVPPLCVAGLCLGGGLYGQAFGAIMLFLANFVAIQLASGIVFTLAGLSNWAGLRRDPALLRALALNLVLLACTAWFLEQQLHQLLRERYADRVTREVVGEQLVSLPGARLESTRLSLRNDRLQIDLLVRSPEELTVGFAHTLRENLQKRLPETIDLRVGTALSSYVSPEGRLFAPLSAQPGPEDLFHANTEWALQESIKNFSQVELANFRNLRFEPPEVDLLVSLRSPYLFDGELVARLQRETQQFLNQRGKPDYQLRLTVRTTLIRDYTEEGPLEPDLDLLTGPADRHRQEIEQRAQRWLRVQSENLPGAWVLDTRANLIHFSQDREELEVFLSLQAPTPLRASLWTDWRTRLERELGLPVRLEVNFSVGQHLELPAVLPNASATRRP